jgi:hypothetical protein
MDEEWRDGNNMIMSYLLQCYCLFWPFKLVSWTIFIDYPEYEKLLSIALDEHCFRKIVLLKEKTLKK